MVRIINRRYQNRMCTQNGQNRKKPEQNGQSNKKKILKQKRTQNAEPSPESR